MPTMSTRRAERGFTLIEICLVVFLAVMLLSVAMPSLSGQLSRRRLQESSDRLDALITRARERSVAENRPYQIVWEKGGSMALYPADASEAAREKTGPASALTPTSDHETYTLIRGASLTAKPAPEWTFWPTGNCEAVTVHYEGSPGEWEAAYSPLSGQGTFTRFIAR